MSQFGVVLVTAGSEAEAMELGNVLVSEKLAACVNIVPIQSLYTWQGSLQKDIEWQLLIKTDLARFEALEKRIQALHSYEVPEIIALPVVAGNAAYLNWIGEQTAP